MKTYMLGVLSTLIVVAISLAFMSQYEIVHQGDWDYIVAEFICEGDSDCLIENARW